MHRILVAFVLMLSPYFLHASERPNIRSMLIHGNHAFSERHLLESMSSKPNEPFINQKLQEDIGSLLNLYHQNGYYFTEVQLDSLVFEQDSSSVSVFIAVAEGHQMTIGKMNFEGNTALTKDEILSKFDTRIGGFLYPQTLERDLNDLVSRYERIGYPFAKIEVRNIQQLPDDSLRSLQLDIAIDEDSKITINEVTVAGNKETKENVIIRESRIKLGQAFDQDNIKKIQQRLNRLNIFSSINEPELYVNASGGGLLISVQDGTTNTFDGILGYVPASSQGESGALTGVVNVAMRNLFGTARKLNIHWEQDGTHSQEIALRYVEPWVLDIPVNIEGSFFQRQQDTSYVRREIGAKADLLVTESFSVGALIHHESIIPSSILSAQIVFNSRTITTGIELLYDSRDDLQSPTGGVKYQSDYQIGSKKIFDLPIGSTVATTTSTVQKLSLDLDCYVQPIQRQVIAVGLHARQRISDRIEVGDLYRFGGGSTLRGYRENQFLGSRVAWTNTEYRFLLSQHSFFYGFFDSGYYFLPGDDVKQISSVQHLKYGYGIGIRLETSLGNIGVSFALGEGDSFTQAKIHIGLVNEF